LGIFFVTASSNLILLVAMVGSFVFIVGFRIQACTSASSGFVVSFFPRREKVRLGLLNW
jgi:hypothetical protein